MLDRGEQCLAFGNQQTQILGPFSGFLERCNLLGGVTGARILGDLEQDSHTHGIPRVMGKGQQSDFP
jgi:hypothetical protein